MFFYKKTFNFWKNVNGTRDPHPHPPFITIAINNFHIFFEDFPKEWECKKTDNGKQTFWFIIFNHYQFIVITRNIFEEKKERQYVSCQPQGLCSLAVRIHQHLVLHSHPLFFTISFYLHPFSFHQINTWNYLLTLSFLPYSSSSSHSSSLSNFAILSTAHIDC